MKKIQGLYLELIEETNYPGFDGRKIAADLNEHMEDWYGVYATTTDNLNLVRGLPKENRVNQVYVRYSAVRYEVERNPLYLIAESTWNADDVEVDDYGMEGSVVLKYTWDVL